MLKIDFFKCYVSIPLKRTVSVISRKISKYKYKFNRLREMLFKSWYCACCKKYHSARVVAFDYADGLSDMVCSDGIPTIFKEIKEDGYSITLEEITLFIGGYIASEDEAIRIREKLIEENPELNNG